MQKKHAPHDADIKVGQNIRAIRTARGISQEKLAEAIGVTFQQVQKYEKGTNRVSASRITQICAALKCELGQIFTGVDNQDVKPMAQVSVAGSRVAAMFDAIEDQAQRKAIVALLRSMTAATVAETADA